MSTDDFLSTPKPNLYSSSAKTLLKFIVGLLLALTAIVIPFFALGGLFLMLCLFSGESRNTDGPAPDASYAVRRAWGEEKLKHHFRAADNWVRNSSQIARDVGTVSGVAPTGSPNSFGSSFGESWAALNLQVIGDKGEGVLRLPNFCADSSDYIGGFDDGSWIFEKRSYPVFEDGKSQLERLGVDSLYDQILDFAAKEDHASVVMTCRLLERSFADHRPESVFSELAYANRFKLLTQYADSLAETSSKTESINIYVQAAAFGLAQLLKRQQYYDGTKPAKDQIQTDLEGINAVLQKAHSLEPDNQTVLKLASWRALFAYQNQCESMLFKCEDLDSDQRQQRVRQELKGMFEYAEQLAKRSPWLRAQLGSITTQPEFKYAGVPKATRIHWSGLPSELTKVIGNNNCENYGTLRVNPDNGRYQSYIGIAIKGAYGKTGRLTVFVQETDLPESRLDLFSETPRGPRGSNFTASIIRWKEKGKRYVSLCPTTLDRKKKK